jgi:hypothetical protein
MGAVDQGTVIAAWALFAMSHFVSRRHKEYLIRSLLAMAPKLFNNVESDNKQETDCSISDSFCLRNCRLSRKPLRER